MKPGDLVKFIKPSTKEIGQYYLVLELHDNGAWVKLDDDAHNLYHHAKDLTVVSTA